MPAQKIAAISKASPRAEQLPVLSYRDFLQTKADEEGMRKGIRTGLRIRGAACELLEGTTPDKLKIQDICTLTGIAQGTMYQYFADRDHLLATLLQEFAAFLHDRMEASTLGSTSPEESMQLATQMYCRLFEANKGLMKCLLHHYDAFPQARGIVAAWNKAWIDTIVGAIRKRQRFTKGKHTGEVELRRRAYALGGMVDQYLAGIYLHGDAHLAAVAGDTRSVVRTLTFIWFKAFEEELAAVE